MLRGAPMARISPSVQPLDSFLTHRSAAEYQSWLTIYCRFRSSIMGLFVSFRSEISRRSGTAVQISCVTMNRKCVKNGSRVAVMQSTTK